MQLIRQRRWKLRDDLGKAMFPVAHGSLHRIADIIREPPGCDVRTDWRWSSDGRELSGIMTIMTLCWHHSKGGTLLHAGTQLSAQDFELRDELERRHIECFWADRMLTNIAQQRSVLDRPPEHVPFDIAPYATLFREMPADYQPPSLNCNRAYNSDSDSPVADAEKRA